MKKFDIAYKFTVVGVKTIEDFSSREAFDTFRQDLVDEIQIDLGDSSMLQSLKSYVHLHNSTELELETTEIMNIKAKGMSSLSTGVVPYSSQFETEATPD